MGVFNGIGQYLSVIVDVTIVSYLIYKLLQLLRGTRSIQLLKGISVVVAGWMLSAFLQLSTLRWLIENLFELGLLVIIIIFQPELRRALEQLGRGRLFSNRGSLGEEQVITRIAGDIAKAAAQCSVQKIGALVVIERDTGLSDYIETGVPLDAELSAELLTNIFMPNAPLHDGAVIMRKGRVEAASCYLPLSENPFISKELGTRHRAGIGITEMSDAIALIVSEETGHISLAIHGQLERGLSEEELLSRLYIELRPPEKSASFWSKRGEKRE
ncbi:diadenylate cyclase CdaA [Mechercharimyces sp. CAU 1602]|uniref:diadenylate cyclase CdaA n=1 Tax=Mechercharimyces sp. CAU 1602 TaxID=2973933 RepID=UPI00216220BA|nr:diadenylate cyclase CdaA [Mechercharimyces sp. CAU 1602]MCS1352087.1 diadenylate cyclase CdaA [Mechercharimyces sp. CAU 1602]